LIFSGVIFELKYSSAATNINYCRAPGVACSREISRLWYWLCSWVFEL